MIPVSRGAPAVSSIFRDSDISIFRSGTPAVSSIFRDFDILTFRSGLRFFGSSGFISAFGVSGFTSSLKIEIFVILFK